MEFINNTAGASEGDASPLAFSGRTDRGAITGMTCARIEGERDIEQVIGLVPCLRQS